MALTDKEINNILIYLDLEFSDSEIDNSDADSDFMVNILLWWFFYRLHQLLRAVLSSKVIVSSK